MSISLVNNLTPDIPFPVEYHAILMHKPLEKDCFSDYCNRLYLSDNKTPGTIDISDPNWDSRLVGEYPAWLWLSKNIRPIDRATLHHYRRKLTLSTSETVLPLPVKIGSDIISHLAYFHSEVIAEAFFNTLTPYEQKIVQGKELLCWNIFKTTQPIIAQWVEYCGKKLEMLAKVLGVTIDYESIKDFVKSDTSKLLEARENKNTDLTYQMRFMACCLERYSHIFWTCTQVPRNYQQVILLEDNQKI